MTQREYRPPSRRRMQVEAWAVVVLFLAGWWCLVGGLWMAGRIAVTLARMLIGA